MRHTLPVLELEELGRRQTKLIGEERMRYVPGDHRQVDVRELREGGAEGKPAPHAQRGPYVERPCRPVADMAPLEQGLLVVGGECHTRPELLSPELKGAVELNSQVLQEIERHLRRCRSGVPQKQPGGKNRHAQPRDP